MRMPEGALLCCCVWQHESDVVQPVGWRPLVSLQSGKLQVNECPADLARMRQQYARMMSRLRGTCDLHE